MSTVLVAVATSAVTTLCVDFTMKPRLEARKARLLAVHASRDDLGKNVLAILASCVLLKETQQTEGDPDLAKLLPERERWRVKIDESTLWLIDNLESYALSYISVGGVQNLLIGYVQTARGVWLSERDETAKIDLLAEMSEYVREIFFAFWWVRVARLADRRTKLAAAIARANGNTDEQPA